MASVLERTTLADLVASARERQATAGPASAGRKR
jgi:hypothetical protein